MNELSITFFGLLLALLLIQIKQKHAGKIAVHDIKNSLKKDGSKGDSNGQVPAAKDSKILKSQLSTTNGKIKSETTSKKNGKQMKGKLLKFPDGSTKFKVQKNIQFHIEGKKLKSAANGKKGTEKKSSVRDVLNPRKRRRRSSRELPMHPPKDNHDGNSQENSNCKKIKNKNFNLSCHGEMSCRRRCQTPRHVVYEAQLSCFCDQECGLFQDCCADYDVFCGASAQNLTKIITIENTTVGNLVTQGNRNLWKCYKGEKLPGINGVWMIGSCPRSWPEDDVLYKCRNLSTANTITRNNYQYLPVYTSNGRVYHNRFCAQCNGDAAKNITSYSLSIECPFSPPQDLSLEAKLTFLFQYCSNKVNWKAIEGQPRRYCLHFQTSRKGILGRRKFSQHQIQCDQGPSRVVNTANEIYKNVECARYIGEDQCVSCGPNISNWQTTDGDQASGSEESFLPAKPLSLIFDFIPKSSSLRVKTQCRKNKVYDHYLEICREGISPGLPINASHFSEYQVVLWVRPPKMLVNFLIKITANYFLAKVFGIAQQELRNFDIQNLENPTIQKIQFTLEITQNERSLPSIKRFLDFTSPFNISLVGQAFTVVKVTSRILSCVNQQRYDRSEYTVLHDGSSAVSIKRTGEVFRVKDYYINTTDSISANDSQAIFVCRLPQISNCSGVYILINEGEFRVLMNKSIFVNASKQVYDWSEYTWVNKSVLVCENFKSEKVSTDDPVLTTITIVCMSLSIIGLVFVLVTYSLFSELRTPPGINLMNLSVSILLAQLLWLLGSGQTDTPMACTAIAVILHYLFLVSFVWTSIIAFDTWRAFSSKERRPLANSRPERMKHCLRHMAVGWFPALAYVGICVVLDLTDNADIGYMMPKVGCWMASKWASLYFFAVPVLILLVFNLVFFILTFRAIKVTTTQTRAASDHSTQKYFGIYVRIASLMGFTWIFGFAAPFERGLSYPFVILNGLQGVYIALAFPLSKRARSLYKQWLKGKPSQKTTVASSTSRTKAQDSEYSGTCYDTKL